MSEPNAEPEAPEEIKSKGHPVKIGKNGQITIPKEMRTEMRIEDGDWLVANMDIGPSIVLEKPQPTLREKLGSFKHFALFILVASMALVSPAFAQEDQAPDMPTNSTVPETPQATPVSGLGIPTFVYRSGAAYFPLTVEIKYPAGFEDVEKVSTISTLSPHRMIKTLTPDGLILKTFTAEVGDTFTIELGQKYSFPRDEVVTWVATANGNVVAEGSMPFKGAEFNIRLLFSTSPAPRLPTQDELNAGVYTRLDNLNLKVDGIESDVQTTRDTTIGSLGVFQNVAGLNGISVIVNIGLVIVAYSVMRSRRVKVIQQKPPPIQKQPEQPKEKKGWRPF